MRWNQGRRTGRAGIVVCVVLAVAVAGLAVAWPTGHPAGGQREAARPHPAGGGSATALPRPSCGWIGVRLINGTTPQLVASHGALACFNRAARECTAASISDTLVGGDAGTSYVFVIEPGGASCRVMQLAQGYSVSFGLAAPAGPVLSTVCRRTAVTASGVTLNCGGPDILIPAKVTVKSPEVALW